MRECWCPFNGRYCTSPLYESYPPNGEVTGRRGYVTFLGDDGGPDEVIVTFTKQDALGLAILLLRMVQANHDDDTIQVGLYGEFECDHEGVDAVPCARCAEETPA